MEAGLLDTGAQAVQRGTGDLARHAHRDQHQSTPPAPPSGPHVQRTPAPSRGQSLPQPRNPATLPPRRWSLRAIPTAAGMTVTHMQSTHQPGGREGGGNMSANQGVGPDAGPCPPGCAAPRGGAGRVLRLRLHSTPTAAASTGSSLTLGVVGSLHPCSHPPSPPFLPASSPPFLPASSRLFAPLPSTTPSPSHSAFLDLRLSLPSRSGSKCCASSTPGAGATGPCTGASCGSH